MPDAARKTEIEILTFEGCPNREHAITLVSGIVAELGTDAEIRIVDVPDAETAAKTRFLGSPTIRVNGGDIEPGADERRYFVHSCRVFKTEWGLSGQPDAQWLRDALVGAGEGAS